MLRQLLRDEEKATITALREEEEQKKQMDEGEAGGDQQTHLSSFTHNQRYGGDDER